MRGLHPNAKLLLTPPEIGPNGQQGIPAAYEPSPVKGTDYGYYIGAHVSDEKLARILTMYEALSFDPELYVLSYYGIEGEDYTWAGEPYQSGINILANHKTDNGPGIYVSHVFDGNAGKFIYDFPYPALYEYASGEQAKALYKYPYKADPYGAYAGELGSVEAKFPKKNMDEAAQKYYIDILSGEKDLDSTWDEYIAELNEYGLYVWNAYYEQLTIIE
jgi:hypothetical protein